MKVAIIYNKDIQGVINTFGIQNKEFYQPAIVEKVAKSLEAAGHNVLILDGNKQIIERLENFMPRVMEGEQMGMVFNMAYGIQGESRYTHIPSLLEMLGVPYVGSSPSGHALALDKVLTKIIWKSNGLPTPDFWVFNSSAEDLGQVSYPVIVKPKMESVSFGLKVVHNEIDLKAAVNFIVSEFSQPALVEQFIRGREFCVGLLGNSPIESFPVLEIDLEGNPDGIQNAEDKQHHPRRKICPAHVPPKLAKEMQKVSIEAFKALNLRDFARVDIRLSETGEIFLLEINSMASLGENGSYLAAAKTAGYNFDEVTKKMLDVASVRYFSNTLMHHLPEEGKKRKVAPTVRIRTFIKARQQQTEKFLKNLVDADSYVRNVMGVNHCIELIGRELSQLGFTQEIFPQLEVGNMVHFSNSFEKQADYLLLLNVDNRLTLAKHENFKAYEQYLEGTGIWEHKGGIALTLAALQALRFIKALKKVKIGILLITDSSIDNKYSKNIIHQKSLNASKTIAVNGSSPKGGLILSRSGSAQFHLEIKLIKRDNPEHVAITAFHFNKMLSAITELSASDPENVIAPYKIDFQSNIFKIYAHGTAAISVRFNSNKTLKEIEQRIRKIIQQQKRNKVFQIHLDGGLKRPEMVKTENNSTFYQEIERIAKKIDVRISPEHRWSSSDICLVDVDLPKIDGMGPVGEFLPSSNERIIRHSLVERALLMALILLKSK